MFDIEDLRSNIYFNWSHPDMGFGQLSVDWNRETQQWVVGNECMRREKVREVLLAWVNEVCDNGAMDCPHHDEDFDPRNLIKE